MGVVLLLVVRVGGDGCIPFVVMVVMVMGVEVRVLFSFPVSSAI